MISASATNCAVIFALIDDTTRAQVDDRSNVKPAFLRSYGPAHAPYGVIA
jgi:hypothetical protein